MRGTSFYNLKRIDRTKILCQSVVNKSGKLMGFIRAETSQELVEKAHALGYKVDGKIFWCDRPEKMEAEKNRWNDD